MDREEEPRAEGLAVCRADPGGGRYLEFIGDRLPDDHDPFRQDDLGGGVIDVELLPRDDA